jgi:formate/nitrite transporter
MADGHNVVDALYPVEIARKVEAVGVIKANLPFQKMALLAVMAGAFVALGALFYFNIVSDLQGGSGMQALAGGFVFNLGLMLCTVGGAELFTGNNLLSMAFASKKISWKGMLRNWATVWTFNFVGALVIVGLAYMAQHWAASGNLVGAKALYVGVNKAALPISVIFFRGILCNVLVCLASWLTYAGKTVVDKFFAMLLPIMAFVAGGFEHSVANMFYLPYAMLLKSNPTLVELAHLPAGKLEYLNWANIGKSLTFATAGNLVGGAVMVGMMYWMIYLKDDCHGSRTEKKAA